MKKIMVVFWEIFGGFIKWYMKKNKYDIANGASYTMIVFVLFALIVKYLDIISVAFMSKTLFVLFVIMILVAMFESESKWVKRITKNRLSTPKELLKKFSNVSYLYGMVYWFASVEIYTYVLLSVLFNVEIAWIPYVIGNVMFYTFLWFTYHLYMNNSLGSAEEKYAIIKLKLQLYGAIASSISIIFLFVDLFNFKIMISMLVVVYTWINYIIECEVQNNKGFCDQT